MKISPWKMTFILFLGTADCDSCGKSFTGASNLRRHMAVKHPELKTTPSVKKTTSSKLPQKSKCCFKCEVCNIQFDTKRELREHKRSLQHANDRHNIFCEHCNKPLKSQLYYEQHIIKFHAKGHLCKLCDQRFDLRKVSYHMGSK